MANLLWGKVYFQNQFAGILRQEPGDVTSFAYDDTYLNTGGQAIAHTLPLRTAPHISHMGLPSFFDNLVAEGWLEQAQMRLLEKREISRFELLLAFGYDCAGAVSIVDPEPAHVSDKLIDLDDPKEMALLTSRASLSGIQPKLAVIYRDGKYYPTKMGELSTHIAKFPSERHADLIDNEYICTQIFKAWVPDENVVEAFIGPVEGQPEPALIIKRFDRTHEGRIHFEEFNALLDRRSNAKYNGSYKEMSDFIRNTSGCLPAENLQLYKRILVGILIGNTDMHFKNFAMFHTPNGLRLVPAYDAVAAALYQYKTMALTMAGAPNARIGELKARQIVLLGKEFQLSFAIIEMVAKELEKNKEAAFQAMADANIETVDLKEKLMDMMEKRWNGTFALIGQALSKKQ